MHRRSPFRTAAGLLLAGAVLLAGCERIKDALRPGDGADPRWQGDSTLLASKPDFLFRVKRTDGRTRIVPFATVGARGFHTLSFSDRGWRAFDLTYLQKGSTLINYEGGRVAGTTTMDRGMWDQGVAPLDTIPGCYAIVPNALAPVANGTSLLSNGKRPSLKSVQSLSGGELQNALSTISTLIAPTSGISGSMLSRYRRDVHVVAGGTAAYPSIVVIYDDPEVLPDTASTIVQRPRHLIVVLDRGVYGYRPSYTYTTIGNRAAPARYYFVDYFDVDDDGKAEIFLGTDDDRLPKDWMYTVVLRFQNEVWRESLRYEGRPCQ